MHAVNVVSIACAVAVLLVGHLRGCTAIPAPCSACEAVASVLQRKLESERPRDPLDMRHRLDKHGKRYGKVIDYKMSELRAVELLEDLCDDMADWTLYTDAAHGGEQHWIKHKGEGAAWDLTDLPLPEENKVHGKHIIAFCHLLLEENEDAVVEALRSDAFATDAGVAPVLCQQISTKCKDRDFSQPSSSSHLYGPQSRPPIAETHPGPDADTSPDAAAEPVEPAGTQQEEL